MVDCFVLAQQAAPSPDAPGSLLETLVSSGEDVVIPIVFILAVVLIVAIVTTARTVSVIAKRRADARLKQDMLDRGMTADEIKTVIEAALLEGRAAPRPPTQTAH